MKKKIEAVLSKLDELRQKNKDWGDICLDDYHHGLARGLEIAIEQIKEAMK